MGNSIGCIVCGRGMLAVVVPKMALGKHVVDEVSLYRCKHCGAEMVAIGEYERIRRKLAGLE